MLRALLASSFSLIVLAGCGDTRHPVRHETIAPPSEPIASANADRTDSGEMPALPPGHPPMSAMQGGMRGMPPAGGALGVKTPEGWNVVQPKSSMIQAEFALPKAEGDEEDGRLTVMMAGGSIEANIQRWRGQFEDLEDKPVEEIDISGTKATLVDLSGTYNDQRGMMGPATKRPGYRMLAAIIETPGGMLFVKGYGPASTMAKHADQFRAFVASLASPAANEATPAAREASPAANEATSPDKEPSPTDKE